MSSLLRRDKDLPPSSDYVTAAEATRLLKVKAQTLYTYVSRGLVRSVAQPDSKERLYYREDIDRVRARGEVRLGHGAMAESALRWGQPVINTAITEITPEGPRYRGESAIELAQRGRSFESVAELLWTGIQHHAPLVWEHDAVPEGFAGQLDSLVRRGADGATRVPILRTLALATTLLGAAEPSSNEIRRGTTVPAARQLILTHTACLGYLGPAGRLALPAREASVAETAARALVGEALPRTVEAVNALLVLCADHELSSATFAARIAASTGAELRACVLAAIAAQSGALLGGGCDRIEDLIAEARTADELRERLDAVERAGSRVPGFNIVAYPKGDPRARALLALAAEVAPANERAQRVAGFIRDAEERFELKPSIEVGLVALCTALDLPPRAAGALWAIGRTAGWIAHVMEQRLAGFLLRPRARYVA
jgi:citrate synthase